jgi:hypothetical protein
MSDPLDIPALRAVAEKATPGPHEARFVPMGAPADCCDYGVVSVPEGRETCRVWRRDDAEFYATFDPPTVMALLDRLSSYREALDDRASVIHWEPMETLPDDDRLMVLAARPDGMIMTWAASILKRNLAGPTPRHLQFPAIAWARLPELPSATLSPTQKETGRG